MPSPVSAQEAATAAGAASDKAARLDALYEQYWEELLKLNPLQATFQGDNRYNDQLPDFYSAKFRAKSHYFTTRWLQKIEAVGSEGLSGQDLLSYEIFVRDAKDSLESEKYPGWMRSEEHTSEHQSLMRISYAVFCLQKKNRNRSNGISML